MEKKKYIYKAEYWLSFLLPILFILIAFAFSGIYPFGGMDILTCDLKEQYFDITAAFFNKIKNGGNIFVLNETRAGLNLYVMAAFLLFSPFNILFLFFDVDAYPYLYELIYILKIGFAGLSACVFLKKSRLIDIKNAACIAFSAIYALGTYNMVCSINIMWLDSVILLPLCFLGIEHLAEQEKITRFAVPYFICVVTCYYHAYITGLISFIYLLYYTAAAGKKNLIKTSFLLLFGGVLSLMLAGFVIVPSAVGLYSGYTNKVEVVSDKSFVRFGLGEICRALLLVEDGSPVINSTLNIFTGVLPVFMTLVYIFSGGINKRERIAAALIGLFLVLSLFIRPLYVLMQFLREPASFECRFAYGISLMLIVFSARLIGKIDKIEKRSVLTAFAVMVFAFAAAFIGGVSGHEYYTAALSAAFTVCYIIFILRKAGIRIFSLFACAEMLITAILGINTIHKHIGHDKKGSYTAGIEQLKELNEKIGDSAAYRICALNADTRMLNVSSGISAIDGFSSTVNQRATDFMKKTGIHVVSDDKYVSSIDNGIVNESIFNVKYVILPDKSGFEITDSAGRRFYLKNGARLTSNTYKKIYEDESSVIYENKTVLPLMFASDEKIKDIGEKFYDDEVISGYFLNQEIFLNTAANTDEKLYTPYYDIGEPLLLNCTLDGDGITNSINLGNNYEGTVLYRFKAEEDGEYCINFYVMNKSLSESFGSYKLSVNGAEIDHEYLKNNLAKDIGYFKKGDIIEAAVTAYKSGVEFVEPCILRLDTKGFERVSQKLQKDALKNIRTENDDILAESDFDSEKFIFTTIAYDEGYRVYIDGKETKKIAAADSMLGFYIPAGSHSIKIDYISKGFKEGVYLSLFTFAAIICLTAIKKRRIKRPLN